MRARCATRYPAARLTLVLLLAGCDSLHGHARQVLPGELLIGTRRDAGVTESSSVAWIEAPALHAAAREDLTLLRDALERAAPSAAEVIVSEDGFAVAVVASGAAKQGGTDAHAGVTVFPDWRAPDDSLHFPDASRVRFLSNHHVELSHDTDDGTTARFIVDLRRPSTRFELDGYRTETLCVADFGMWVCVRNDGVLCTGHFHAENPAASVVGAELPIPGACENAILRLDGSVLVIERSNLLLESYPTSNWMLAATVPGHITQRDGAWSSVLSGRDGFVTTMQRTDGTHEQTLRTVNGNGQFGSIVWPQCERYGAVAPSRQFVICASEGDAARVLATTPQRTSDVAPQTDAADEATNFTPTAWLRWSP